MPAGTGDVFALRPMHDLVSRQWVDVAHPLHCCSRAWQRSRAGVAGGVRVVSVREEPTPSEAGYTQRGGLERNREIYSLSVDGVVLRCVFASTYTFFHSHNEALSRAAAFPEETGDHSSSQFSVLSSSFFFFYPQPPEKSPVAPLSV